MRRLRKHNHYVSRFPSMHAFSSFSCFSLCTRLKSRTVSLLELQPFEVSGDVLLSVSSLHLLILCVQVFVPHLEFSHHLIISARSYHLLLVNSVGRGACKASAALHLHLHLQLMMVHAPSSSHSLL